MYIFGSEVSNLNLKASLKNILSDSKQKKLSFSKIKVSRIVEILSRLEAIWSQDGEYYQNALDILSKESSFSSEMDRATLDIIPSLFSKANLQQRLLVDFRNPESLDEYVSIDFYQGHIKYNPLGLLLHVTAGNVFLGCIDSLIMGLLTKNVSLVKLSSTNLILPHLFIKSLEQIDHDKELCENICLLNWKGGDTEIESQLKNGVDGIITWGGEEMANSYQNELPLGVKLIQHGPKISFHVISRKALLKVGETFFDSIVKDVVMWDQSACANSQNIFLESGIDIDQFMFNLNQAFIRTNIALGTVSDDEATEILKDYQLALYQEYLTGHQVIKNDDYMISFEQGCTLSPTALNRTVKIKTFNSLDSLRDVLSEFKVYLQTCGLGVNSSEEKIYMDNLGLSGVSRFTKVGEMLSGNIGSPHDGSFSLAELVKVHCLESTTSIEKFAVEMTQRVSLYENKSIYSFSDIPIIDGTTLSKHSIHNSDMMIDPSIKEASKVFSTGGTTGKPKYCLYTDSEFKETSMILAKSYINLGLNSDDLVINLFMAGNMWSSFSAIQYSLEYAGVKQFPMGGLASVEDIAQLIKDFQINVIFGLPSTILSLLNSFPDLKIEKIFYAGEFLSSTAQRKITENWKCSKIFSAGYATVDVGPIGYQTLETKGSEHILFNDLIHLEVIDDEAVVTSKIRKAMPILRYRTGDKVRILESTAKHIKFELLGRIDERINIWSSRIEKNEITESLNMFFGIIPQYQVVLEQVSTTEKIYDKLTIRLPHNAIKEGDMSLFELLYKNCMDLNRTISYEIFLSNINVSHEDFIINAKTGKQKTIFDQR
jgi:phenylacetate-coenzyme A ligase PaaK-like adenylate-forming protein